MNTIAISNTRHNVAFVALLFVVDFALASVEAREDGLPALVDDFSDPERSTAGFARMVVDDSSVGGQSTLKQTFSDGVLVAKGQIVPARGQPGWMSTVLLLSTEGEPADLSQYEGVRIRVLIDKGHLSVAANSAEIDNYDYHSAVVPLSSSGAFQDVRIPFKDMKRAWSEQTPLNPATLTSISLISVGMQKGEFAYEVDEVGFY